LLPIENKKSLPLLILQSFYAYKSTAIITACLLIPACGPFSSRIAYDPKPSIDQLKNGHTTIENEVDKLATPLIRSGESPALAIGVLLPNGTSRVFGYGNTKDLEESSVPDQTSIFQVGSISKLFVSTALDILVQEGKISYNDKIKDILPKNTPLSEDIANITVYELATHTSGLPREPITFKQFCYFIRYEITGNNLYSYMDKRWIYKYLKSCKTRKNHHKYIYSNIGYGLLAHLIEIKTGKPFSILAKEKIFLPLDMKDTTFSLSNEQYSRLVTGHAGDQPFFMRRNTPIKPWDMGEIMSPTGGIYSTVEDLLKFIKYLFKAENTSLAQAITQTLIPISNIENGDIAGLGWDITENNISHVKIIYKHGMASGYNAYIGLNISNKSGAVVLSNAFNWSDKIGENILLRLAPFTTSSNAINVDKLSHNKNLSERSFFPEKDLASTRSQPAIDRSQAR